MTLAIAAVAGSLVLTTVAFTITTAAFAASCIGCTGVEVAGLHTMPPIVVVHSTFGIGAIVINLSPSTIMFIAGPCDKSLSATFNKNVLIKHSLRCLIAAHLVKLRPGQEALVTGPNISGIEYQAVAAGQTTASVTFHYQIENGHSASVTKQFVFTISPSF
jgi:hypothetical protein